MCQTFCLGGINLHSSSTSSSGSMTFSCFVCHSCTICHTGAHEQTGQVPRTHHIPGRSCLSRSSHVMLIPQIWLCTRQGVPSPLDWIKTIHKLGGFCVSHVLSGAPFLVDSVRSTRDRVGMVVWKGPEDYRTRTRQQCWDNLEHCLLTVLVDYS